MHDQSNIILKLIKTAESLKNFCPEEEYNRLMEKGISKQGFTYRYPDKDSEQLLFKGEVIATFPR